MDRNRLLVIAVLGGVAMLGLSAVRQADAIPAFARKYEFSCSTCHAPFPRLKPFGEEFAARGFRMEDPSKEPPRATYDVGDPLLHLTRLVPLAIRLDGYASWKEDEPARTDVEFPWSFKILSGGPISDHISYYFYGIMEAGETIKLEDTFFQFNSIFHLPVDLNVGQFQVSDPLFKRELRLERADYAIFKTRVGHSSTDLTYDRGAILTWHAPGQVDALLLVLNGNGIEPAENDNYDNDRLKSYGLRLVRPFGPLRLGVFGYQGKHEDENCATNKVTYFGPDLMLDLGEKFQLNLEYLERRDDDPYFAHYTGRKYETSGGFVELHYLPHGADGRWVISALYNKVDSDDPEALAESASLTVNHLLARNLRLMVEGARDLEHCKSRFSIGVITAF